MAWRIRQKWMKAIYSYVHDIPLTLSFRKYGNSSKQHRQMISKFWPWKHIPVNVRSVWSFYGLCFFPVQSGSIPGLSVYSTNFSKFQILHQHFPLPIRYIYVTNHKQAFMWKERRIWILNYFMNTTFLLLPGRPNTAEGIQKSGIWISRKENIITFLYLCCVSWPF